jgi:hypothetical protein
VKGGNKPRGAADNERRIQRLKDIIDELGSSTELEQDIEEGSLSF